MSDYTLDTTGAALRNKVIGESRVIKRIDPTSPHLWFVPKYAPFYDEESLAIRYIPKSGPARNLQYGVDYHYSHRFQDASAKTGRSVFASISFVDITLDGTVLLNYQTLGGAYTLSAAQILQVETTESVDPDFQKWETVMARLSIAYAPFPTVDHPWASANIAGIQSALGSLEAMGYVVSLRSKILPTPEQAKFIPSPAEIGLGRVSNFATATIGQSILADRDDLLMTPAGTAALVSDAIRKRLSDMGYQLPTPYAAGIQFNDNKLSVECDGVVYVARTEYLPFVSNGDIRLDRKKLMAINATSATHWKKLGSFVVAASTPKNGLDQLIFDTGYPLTHLHRAKAVQNDVTELIYGQDFWLNDMELCLGCRTTVGDRIMVHVRPTSSRATGRPNFYQVATVSSASNVFQLRNFDGFHSNDLRITLNDWMILDEGLDYDISSSGVLTVNYRLRLGDILEIEDLDSIPDFGRQQTRAILWSVGPITGLA